MDAPKVARQRIADRMEALDAQKVELEADAARLRVASEIQLTEPEIRAWLHTFTQGDPTDENFRRRVIDVFINTIYLYDDRVLIFYNIRGGKQVSYIDLLNSLYVPAQSEGSDLKALGVPMRLTFVWESLQMSVGHASDRLIFYALVASSRR